MNSDNLDSEEDAADASVFSWRRTVTIRNYALLVVAGVCLVVAIAWDATLVQATMSVQVDAGADSWSIIQQELIQKINKMWFLDPKTYINLLKEVSFAALIALGIILSVEMSSRAHEQRSNIAFRRQVETTLNEAMSRQEEFVREFQKDVAEDVTKAVFGISVDKGLVEETIEGVFRSAFHRDYMKLRLAFYPAGVLAGIQRPRYKVEASIEYSITNRAAQRADYEPKFFIPMPAEAALSKQSILNTYDDGENQFTDEQIKQADNDLVDASHERRYQFPPISLEAKTSRTILASWTMFKEISDCEVWTSLAPTTKLTIDVDFSGLGAKADDIQYECDSLHRGTMRPTSSDPRRPSWSSSQPILNFQGVHMWWRPKEVPLDSGNNEAAQEG